MNLLALDLATSTGWATWHNNATSFGSALFKGSVGEALSAYQRWLTDLAGPLSEGGLTIVYEAPWVGPKTHQQVARKLQGLAVVTDVVAHDIGCEAFEVLNPPVILHFTGSAGGKRKERKARTIGAAKDRGFDVQNDDEADAIAILDYAAHCLGIKTNIPDGLLFT